MRSYQLLRAVQILLAISFLLYICCCVIPYVGSRGYAYSLADIRADRVTDTFSGHGFYTLAVVLVALVEPFGSALLGLLMVTLAYYRYRKYRQSDGVTYGLTIVLIAYLLFMTTTTALAIRLLLVD